MSRSITRYLTRYTFGGAIIIFGVGGIHAVAEQSIFSMRLADWKFEAGVGIGGASSTEFTRQFERTSYVFPSGYALSWYNQPWFFKNRLYAGLGIAYLRSFEATSTNGSRASLFAFPLTFEAKYLLSQRLFVAGGIGMAPGTLDLYGAKESTNAFIATFSGGYEYPISSSFSVMTRTRILLASQTFMYESGSELGNTNWNFGMLVGAAFRFGE